MLCNVYVQCSVKNVLWADFVCLIFSRAHEKKLLDDIVHLHGLVQTVSKVGRLVFNTADCGGNRL